jgi:hypothetical protein
VVVGTGEEVTVVVGAPTADFLTLQPPNPATATTEPTAMKRVFMFLVNHVNL